MTEPLTPGAVTAVAEQTLESAFIAKLRADPQAAWQMAAEYVQYQLWAGIPFPKDRGYCAALIRRVGLPRLAKMADEDRTAIVNRMPSAVRETLGL